jgi:hypothetical protein
MAYMNQERKAERAPKIKAILKEYGQKGSLSVRNYSTLALKLKDVAGLFEFKDEYQREWGKSINPYWFEEHYADNPVALEMLKKLVAAMYGDDYFDKSDPMTDYFHCSHYIDIDVFPA